MKTTRTCCRGAQAPGSAVCCGRRTLRVWELVLLALVLMPILVGCAAPAAAGAQLSTTTPLRSPTALPSPTLPAAGPTTETVKQDMPGYLISRRTDSPPDIDGLVDEVWETAELLQLPLTWGAGGTEHALDVELRSLYTDQALFLLAQWPSDAPPGEQSTVSNVFTVHWRIPEPAAQRLDCNVACHTVYADGAGRLAYANAETIPQGGAEALDAAGGWRAGTWTIEWSRPLISSNPYDLQFDDLKLAYSFMVKVFKRIEGRPDPVSRRHPLVFQP